ncbi:MAG: helix-turn-helix domain-containing protein [Lachnospiraceae bacterium]
MKTSKILQNNIDITRKVIYHVLIYRNSAKEEMNLQENGYEAIVSRIHLLIKEKGMKQCVVAERAGFTPNELSSILNDRKLLRVEHINPIAKALDVEPNELFKKGGE